ILALSESLTSLQINDYNVDVSLLANFSNLTDLFLYAVNETFDPQSLASLMLLEYLVLMYVSMDTLKPLSELQHLSQFRLGGGSSNIYYGELSDVPNTIELLILLNVVIDANIFEQMSDWSVLRKFEFQGHITCSNCGLSSLQINPTNIRSIGLSWNPDFDFASFFEDYKNGLSNIHEFDAIGSNFSTQNLVELSTTLLSDYLMCFLDYNSITDVKMFPGSVSGGSITLSNNYLEVSEGNDVVSQYLRDTFYSVYLGNETSPCSPKLPRFEKNQVCYQHKKDEKWKVECAYGYYLNLWSMKCVKDESNVCTKCFSEDKLCVGSLFGNEISCVSSRVRFSYWRIVVFALLVIFGIIFGILYFMKLRQTKASGEVNDLLLSNVDEC
ncbi:hypothetical protein ADUPG1_013501, partial [Aduncisulcus paluster]